MKLHIFAWSAVVALTSSSAGSSGLEPGQLLTRAEATDFQETTTYEEVVDFMQQVAAGSPQIHFTHFGYSMEGRRLPLAVVGVSEPSPEAVRTSGKLRVYLQGNIHGGEVCGKEALLILLRSLMADPLPAWSRDLVLLVAPIYNADGNERVALSHRPRQDGPMGGMGQRRNAQGLDLNRDHMKLETPEARSLLSLLTAYDPQVVVDLHTTNGTHHGYHLTYSPPLNPNTDPEIVRRLRREWLPTITGRMADDGWSLYYYGNLPPPSSSADRPRASSRLERGWYTFDHRPRFGNNYIGLRNRLAILSEAYAYSPFQERVEVTGRFVEEILKLAGSQAAEIARMSRKSDGASVVGQEMALRSTFQRSPEPVEILLGTVETKRHPWTGALLLRRREAVTRETMYEFGTFRPTHTERAPAAYLIPPRLEDVVDHLRTHGIRLETLKRDQVLQVERFEVSRSEQARRPFEGHQERTLEGTYEAVQVTVPQGTYRAPVDQPLGRLLFYLVEPRSDDGLVGWNFLDAELAESPHYPILRVPSEMSGSTDTN